MKIKSEKTAKRGSRAPPMSAAYDTRSQLSILDRNEKER